MTIKKIIKMWLLTRPKGYQFGSHEIELNLVSFGQLYDKLHTPGSYSRAWRELRERSEVNIKEVKKDSAEKWFEII